MPNHYLISPGLGPMISPYPTPQHQPRHFPSPHHDPLLAGKQSSIPTMVLPASALSSSSSSSSEIAPSSGEITATLRSYSTILPQGDHPNPTSVFADRSPSASSSAPGSPRRHSMLPPQSTTKVASMTTSHRSSRSQTRKASSSSGSNNDISRRASTSNPTTTSSSSSSSTKRRGSSHNKVVDQETRDLMRKVSHSAIERRRRERINDKILQLKHLVPACVDEDHLHKLSILQSTIEYIHHLKAILPASVANAKVGKATNNNPNNKTTDMLEALGGSITQKFPLTPLMTTGLNHIYAKQIKLEKQQEVESSLEQGKHHEPPFHPSQSQSRSHHHSRENQDSVNMDGPPSAASSSSSSSSFVCPSSSSSSSDDDAKDGLLLLASQSSVVETENSSNKRGLRKKGYGFGSGKPY
ncbi:hypothetical protein BGX28_007039 [Mortierella sp. GBA30]|nr:hypothetical protein BGX28_007039 [Mortierella sp. GBA30]